MQLPDLLYLHIHDAQFVLVARPVVRLALAPMTCGPKEATVLDACISLGWFCLWPSSGHELQDACTSAIATSCGLTPPLHVAAEVVTYGGKTKEEYLLDLFWPTLFPAVVKCAYVILVAGTYAACSIGEDTPVTAATASIVRQR
jgi:hypothetical protein